MATANNSVPALPIPQALAGKMQGAEAGRASSVDCGRRAMKIKVIRNAIG